MYKFKICTTKEEIALSYNLRYQVFCQEKGWINPKRFRDEQEFDEFDKFSSHYIATDAKGRVIGTARLIGHSSLGLPIEKLVKMNHLDMDEVVEISRLAVLKECRGNEGLVFFGLTRLMWEHAVPKGIKTWAATIDRPLYNLLEHLRMPFAFVGKPVWYVGSESIPVIGEAERAREIIFDKRISKIMKRKGREKVELPTNCSA